MATTAKNSEAADTAALVDAVVEHVTETIRRIVARDGQVPIVSELRRELDLDALLKRR